MKKVNLTSKLSLKKETVIKLNDEQMKQAKGGQINSTKFCSIGNNCLITGAICAPKNG